MMPPSGSPTRWQMDFFRSDDDGASPEGSAHELRPYQQSAVDCVIERLAGNRSTLVVMPTGSGKTRVSTELAIRRRRDRILFLAHRDELLQQGRKRFATDTGELVGLEQAEWYAGDERIVVGSIQTVSMPDRLKRFKPDRFDLVIVDEAHHAPAPTYRRVLDYFGAARVVGVTATPDRADELAMGQVFESVAFVYEIDDAIVDGYLCDVVCTRVHVAELDLSGVSTTAGDLNQGQLDQVMAVEKVMQGVADATIREAGNRRTLLFTTSVDNAHRLAEIMCRHRAGCAKAVDGKTETDTRREILASHQRGEYQYLVNVGIATEGYDDPSIACVAIARPTKSRALYTQMAGRGLRIADGKENCLLLDFVGNSGRHSLASALDVLGGKWTEEEEEIARSLVDKKSGASARQALEDAKEQIAERERQKAAAAAKRASIRGKAIYSKRVVDPFHVLGVDVSREVRMANRFGAKLPSQKQIDCLAKFKIPLPDGLTAGMASALIGKCIERANGHLATYKMVTVLGRYGIDAKELDIGTAGKLITAISENGWKPISPERLSQLTGGDF